MTLEKGLIQVYTGSGKGKTTAALGLALRAAGRGIKVCFIQFMKGGGPYGEHLAAPLLSPYLTILTTGKKGWVNRGGHDPEDLSEAGRGLDLAADALTCGKYGMVVLDEINGAVAYGLIELDKVLALMDLKPEHVELILTGRNAHDQIMEKADLVTEMREIKHYFRAGIKARIGIEK